MRRLKFSDAMTNSTTNLNTNTNMYTGKLSTQEKGTPGMSLEFFFMNE